MSHLSLSLPNTHLLSSCVFDSASWFVSVVSHAIREDEEAGEEEDEEEEEDDEEAAGAGSKRKADEDDDANEDEAKAAKTDE